MNEELQTYYDGTAKVPKEITDIKSVIVFGMTARQLFGAGLGLLCGFLGWKIFLSDLHWTSLLAYLMMALMAIPFFAYGFWRPIGLLPEDYLMIWYSNNVLSRAQRKLFAQNEYERLIHPKTSKELVSAGKALLYNYIPKKRKIALWVVLSELPAILLMFFVGSYAVALTATGTGIKELLDSFFSSGVGSYLIAFVLVIMGLLMASLIKILWALRLNGEIANLTGDRDMIPGKRFLILDLVTFGVYGIIWSAHQGELIDDSNESGNRKMYFPLLCASGLRVVMYALMQKEINRELSKHRLVV